MSLNLTPQFSFFATNTFRHTFIDDLDSYKGSGTEVNDLYSLTSIGASYKFGPQKPKKEKIEIIPIEADTTLALEEYMPVNVITSVNMPLNLKPDESKTVTVVINKGILEGKAEYTQSFPDGFRVEPFENDGGVFSYNVGKLVIHWDDIANDDELMFSYKINPGEITPQNYSIPGTFVYIEKEQVKVKQFKNQIVIEGLPIASNEVNIQKGNEVENPNSSDRNQQNTNPTANGITYAVQVAAVYGGKMNPAGLQKQFKLNEPVTESSYRGYNNYTVGNFDNFSAAELRRQGTNVRGSYVVAFKNGNYLPYLYLINNEIMDQNPFLTTGTTYKVQVLANNGKQYPIVKIAHNLSIEPNKIYEDKTGNWFQYTVGNFESAEKAKKYAEDLKAKGFTDVFVVKFANGLRIR